MQLLNEVIILRENVISNQDTIIAAYKRKVSSCEDVLTQCQGLNTRNEIVITGLRKELQKEVAGRKFWKTIAIIGPIVVGTLMYTER